MKRYTRVTAKVVPLPRSDVDTDQIIPARHLQRLVRTGYGQFLFESWRITPTGDISPDFVLNHPQYSDAAILAAGANFGCGSSREHAVWALFDYGFRTIIAPSFADIFRNNCYQNGILPVTLPASVVQQIIERAESDHEYRVTVDLRSCTVSDSRGVSQPFAIDPFPRECLLEGLDPIDITLRQEREIQAYETAQGIMTATNTNGAHSP